MNETNLENTNQTITLQNRKALTITGTKKIISLKPDIIQLNTTLGNMAILGNNLELIKLDNENLKVDIQGTIDELKFLETKTKQNFFGKIFK